jgi:hypothetical protein
MHDIVKGPNDVDLHFIKTSKTIEMEEIEPMMVNVMDFSIKTLNYPYKQYSFIQGGDGEWNMR